MAVFMSYCPLFCGSRASYTNLRLDTCLSVMTKNPSFSRFKAVFTTYWPKFLCFRATCMAHKTRFMFERCDQKLVVFAFYGRYHELFPTNLGFHGDFHGP